MERKDVAGLLGVAVGGFAAGYFVSRMIDGCSREYLSHNKSYEGKSQKAAYVNEVSLNEPPILTELKQHTIENVPRSSMLSDPVQLQLFRMLLNMSKAERCIEVGSYTGYNVLNCALTIPEGGMVYALDISEDYLKHGRQFFKKAAVDHKITEVIGPAIESLEKFIARDNMAGTIDFIYIDANKNDYPRYCELGVQLLRKGGILALDNMLFGGAVYNSELATKKYSKAELDEIVGGLRQTAEMVKNDPRLEQVLLSIGDGLTLARKL